MIIKEVECGGISNYIDIPETHKSFIKFGNKNVMKNTYGTLEII